VLLAVFCGWLPGTLARYTLSLLLQSWLRQGLALRYSLINLSGALLLALVSVLADRTHRIKPAQRLFSILALWARLQRLAAWHWAMLCFSIMVNFSRALLYLGISLLGGLWRGSVGSCWDVLDSQSEASLFHMEYHAPQCLTWNTSRRPPCALAGGSGYALLLDETDGESALVTETNDSISACRDKSIRIIPIGRICRTHMHKLKSCTMMLPPDRQNYPDCRG